MNPTTPLCCKENLWFKHKGGLRARDCKNMCAPALSVSYRKSDFCPCYIRQNVFLGGGGLISLNLRPVHYCWATEKKSYQDHNRGSCQNAKRDISKEKSGFSRQRCVCAERQKWVLTGG